MSYNSTRLRTNASKGGHWLQNCILQKLLLPQRFFFRLKTTILGLNPCCKGTETIPTSSCEAPRASSWVPTPNRIQCLFREAEWKYQTPPAAAKDQIKQHGVCSLRDFQSSTQTWQVGNAATYLLCMMMENNCLLWRVTALKLHYDWGTVGGCQRAWTQL